MTPAPPRRRTGGRRYAPDTQGILRRFYGAAGIDVRFDPQGRLAAVALIRAAPARTALIHEERTMSDRVTWEVCPRCGEQAAVGWALVARDVGGPADEVAEEFDCPGGCLIDAGELEQLTPSDEHRPADDPRSGL